MIKLNTMHSISATVNDQWESELADTLLARWEHDPTPAKYWRASANFIFFLKRSGQDYVLRFNHMDERTDQAIHAELDYINHLAAQGIRIAQPIPSRTGNLLETITTPNGTFHTVVFERLSGDQHDLDDLTPAQITAWGKALGAFHNAAAHYTAGGRPTWQDHLAFIAATLPADDTLARQTLAQLQAELAQLPINTQNFGLIHFDFELDNIIWDDAQPGIIDLDDCAWYWFAADIAFAVRDLFDDRADNVNLNAPSFQRFIDGYTSVRPLAQADMTHIPLFLRLHNLLTYAKLLRAITPPDPAGEPDWLTDLRRKLTAKNQAYRAGFGT